MIRLSQQEIEAALQEWAVAKGLAVSKVELKRGYALIEHDTESLVPSTRKRYANQ